MTRRFFLYTWIGASTSMTVASSSSFSLPISISTIARMLSFLECTKVEVNSTRIFWMKYSVISPLSM